MSLRAQVKVVCARILALLEQHEESHQVNKTLVQSGHQVVLAQTFDEAIAVVQEMRFDLIISDVHLENGGSIFDFLRWVTTDAAAIKTPFVLFTMKPTLVGRYLEDGVRTTARMLGAAQYITMKCFDAEEFCRQIDSLLLSD
jgi:DNA-binding response OmpR family regulator